MSKYRTGPVFRHNLRCFTCVKSLLFYGNRAAGLKQIYKLLTIFGKFYPSMNPILSSSDVLFLSFCANKIKENS